jgi:acetyl esterase/lipase
VLILQGGKDELVPHEHGVQLEKLCLANGIDVRREVVPGALHTEVMIKEAGQRMLADFILKP